MVTHRNDPAVEEQIVKEPPPKGVVTPFAATFTLSTTPMIEFYFTTGGAIRLRVFDTANAFVAQSDIAAATWTAINTAMTTAGGNGSKYQVPYKYAGAIAQQDLAS